MTYPRVRWIYTSLESLESINEGSSKLTRRMKMLRRWRYILLSFFILLLTGSLGLIHHRFRRTAPSRIDYAEPLIPHPVAPVEAFPVTSAPKTLDDLKAETRTRLEGIGLPASKLECRWDEWEERIYEELRNKGNETDLRGTGRTLIALNLYNSESIVQSLGSNLLTLADFLGQVTISIFENGSTDRTPEALSHLATVLSYANISHRTEQSERERIGRTFIELSNSRNTGTKLSLPSSTLPSPSTPSTPSSSSTTSSSAPPTPSNCYSNEEINTPMQFVDSIGSKGVCCDTLASAQSSSTIIVSPRLDSET